LVHKFLVHSHKLHKIKFLYVFRAQSAHYQEVNDANCTYAASGIVTLCKWPSCATAKESQSAFVARFICFVLLVWAREMKLLWMSWPCF